MGRLRTPAARCGIKEKLRRDTSSAKRLMYFTVGQPLFISPLFSTSSEKLYRDWLILKPRVVRFNRAAYRPDFLNVILERHHA